MKTIRAIKRDYRAALAPTTEETARTMNRIFDRNVGEFAAQYEGIISREEIERIAMEVM